MGVDAPELVAPKAARPGERGGLPRGSLHRDPNTGEVYRLVEWKPGQSRDGKWDMGHLPTEQYAKARQRYLSGDPKFGLEEFISWYRDPANYTVQDPSRNRSRIDD